MKGNSYDIYFTGKQYKIEYLENPVKFGKPRKCQYVKQNLGLKGLNKNTHLQGVGLNPE